MKRNRLPPRGTTLFETMVAVSLGAIVSAAVLTGLSVLQRTWAATEAYAVAQGHQVRIADAVARDLRRALSVTVNDNVLTLTVPDYLGNDGAPAGPDVAPVDPVVVGNNLAYGPTPVTVRYFQRGAAFVREVNGGPPEPIADEVADFLVTAADVGESVTCALTFSPRFTFAPTPDAVAATLVFNRTFLRNVSARP